MKWVKRIVMLVVALVLVAVLAAVAFVATFDPNDYKNRIAAVVKEKTGRTVHFNGDISVSIFPWLGATLKDVSLSNADGFAAKDMLKAHEVEAKAALLPLLKGQFEIGTLVLDGAVINLQRKADGKTNWDDLVAQGKAGAKPQAGKSPGAGKKPLALAVGGVDVRNATLHWQDGVTGQDITLKKLHLTTGSLTLGEPVKLSAGFDYRLALPNQPQLSGRFEASAAVQTDSAMQKARISNLDLTLKADAEPAAAGKKPVSSGLPQQADVHLTAPSVQLSLAGQEASVPAFTLSGKASRVAGMSYVDGKLAGDVTANWGKQTYRSKEMKISGTVKGLPTRTGTLTFDGSGGLQADLAQGTAAATGWRLASDPVVLKTSLKASGIGKALTVKGPVSIEPFSPRALAKEMKYTVPHMQSDQAMTRFALQAKADVTPQQAMLDDLNIDLDHHRFQGKAGLSDLKRQKILLHLKGGKFNLNPYLPPAATKASASAGGSGGGALAGGGNAKIPLPVKALRKLNLDARVSLEQLTYQDYVLGNPVLAVTAAGGKVNLDKLSLAAFSGQLDSHGSLDVRGSVPDWRFSTKTSGVKLQPLLKAVMNEDRLIGTGDLDFNVRAQGDRVNKLKSSLDGNGKFALKNGKIKGVDLGYLLRAAQAGIQGKSLSVPKQQETDFSSITGTAKIRNGVVHNDDLRGASPLLRVEGKGDVDLGRSTIDYVLKAIVVNTATGQQGKALEQLKQVPVPIKISGTFANPKYAVDLQSVLKDKAKQRVQKEIQKKLGDKAAPVQNLLKGLGL